MVQTSLVQSTCCIKTRIINAVATLSILNESSQIDLGCAEFDAFTMANNDVLVVFAFCSSSNYYNEEKKFKLCDMKKHKVCTEKVGTVFCWT